MDKLRALTVYRRVIELGSFKAAADDLLPLVQQAQVLAMQFDAVVANPPCQELERETRLELATSTLARLRSTN